LISSADQTEQIALSVPDNNGVYIVPAFTGLGAPYWNAEARGMVCGLTRGATRAHFVRAALEGIAYQVNDVLVAMEKDAGFDVNALSVDGGASNNNFLLQFQADISKRVVLRPQIVETTALGAAYLAGLTIGYFNDIEHIRSTAHHYSAFTPAMDEEKRNALLKGWKSAVERTTGSTHE
jgi:glycerol kinase